MRALTLISNFLFSSEGVRTKRSKKLLNDLLYKVFLAEDDEF